MATVKATSPIKHDGTKRQPGETFSVDAESAKRLEGIKAAEIIKDKTDYTSMTVKELKETLDESGIEYEDRATKADLISLLGG